MIQQTQYFTSSRQTQLLSLTLYIDEAIFGERDALILGSFGAPCADFGPMLSGTLLENHMPGLYLLKGVEGGG